MPADPWASWLDLVEREGAPDRQLRLLRIQVRDRVIHQARLKAGDQVVDLGCGFGFLSLEAARLVGSEGMVYAVDQSLEALQVLEGRARERGLRNLRVLNADVTRLPLPDERFDAVMARSVLSYVPERKKALMESFRVLRPGGRISLCEPVLGEEEILADWKEERSLWERARRILRENHPAFSFSRAGFLREVEETGFTEVGHFVWFADVGRAYRGELDFYREMEESLPGPLSLARCLRDHGMGEEEMKRLSARLYEESRRPSFRDVLPCVFVWGRKPGGAPSDVRARATVADGQMHTGA